MAREENGRAARRLAAEDLGEHPDCDRVETGEWFVEYEQLRLVQQRRRELGALLVAVGELFDRRVGAPGEAEPLEPARCRERAPRRRSARGASRSTRVAPRPASADRGRAPPACTRSAAALPARSAARPRAPRHCRARQRRRRSASQSSSRPRSGRESRASGRAPPRASSRRGPAPRRTACGCRRR